MNKFGYDGTKGCQKPPDGSASTGGLGTRHALTSRSGILLPLLSRSIDTDKLYLQCTIFFDFQQNIQMRKLISLSLAILAKSSWTQTELDSLAQLEEASKNNDSVKHEEEQKSAQGNAVMEGMNNDDQFILQRVKEMDDATEVIVANEPSPSYLILAPAAAVGGASSAAQAVVCQQRRGGGNSDGCECCSSCARCLGSCDCSQSACDCASACAELVSCLAKCVCIAT